ncbi:flagellar brake protein [Propionivibrio dicarboxylicus]|uniref:C-di-GMP-binding flagellar brake protein YcgR, contains PilZNR and PilZ domains n=1 Tax=Propionivibrio dicarboxylicus TaxID=83767 RepID=A0A1G8AC53_9RHOO|nr:flagellar brake protein [Propionivibrio dicarboxylicus]SDH18528.1 c-di-GMP-binding flagellar brake protein YcgR, contains PilZNR and PilZ domains [Propionivibrio dicarboxylicus]
MPTLNSETAAVDAATLGTLAPETATGASQEVSSLDFGSGSGIADDIFSFEAMRLKVGDRIQMQLPPRFASERVIVRLIGYLAPHSLLVTPPRDIDGFRLPIEESEAVFVRVFANENAFAFESVVSKIVRLPFDYLHLSFPTQVRGRNVRKAPRVKTRIICSFSGAAQDGDSAPGVLVNLSANGALLVSRGDFLSRGDQLRLSFRLMIHGIEVLMNLEAVVRSLIADESATRQETSYFGLEFVNLTPTDRMTLQSMVYQQLIEQPQAMA